MGSMILIDDSGWGSLLGGVMIGIYNEQTKELISQLIPIRYFQGELFKTGKYKEQALKIFLKSLIKLKNNPGFYVICRGTCLDEVYNFIAREKLGRGFCRLEIKDPMQALLEDKYACYLESLGVPRKSKGAHCLSFDNQIKWVQEDPKRIKFVKTGWPSWKEKYGKVY
jgi:hypothetical protein